MNNRLKNWEKLGLLVKTPEERKEFITNSFELLLAYLNSEYNEQDDGRFQTIIFSIFALIGNKIDFSINNFFIIINEVNLGVLNLKHDENSDVDEELIFCREYSENKINELRNQ